MFLAKRPLALRLPPPSPGFPRLLEAAEVAARPAHPESRPEPGRGHPLLGADLAQPAGQDRRVGGPDTGRSHGLHTGTVRPPVVCSRPSLRISSGIPSEIVLHSALSLSAVYCADPLQ